MSLRRATPMLALVLCAPWLAACPGAPGAERQAAGPPADLTSPGMVAARDTFECAAPPNPGTLQPTHVKAGRQWYAPPPGFTVFGLPVKDLGLMHPVGPDSQTIAAVLAPSATVLAAVKARHGDLLVSHPGADPDNQADTGFDYVAWGGSHRLTLQRETSDTLVICDGRWNAADPAKPGT